MSVFILVEIRDGHYSKAFISQNSTGNIEIIFFAKIYEQFEPTFFLKEMYTICIITKVVFYYCHHDPLLLLSISTLTSVLLQVNGISAFS